MENCDKCGNCNCGREPVSVIIVTWPLNDTDSDLNKAIPNDDLLEEAILAFADRLPMEVEIFAHNGNIIATEQGFYGAYHPQQLKKKA